MTDRYAVIGNPVAHSKSPRIHAEFARQTAQDLSYEAILAPLDGFAATVRTFREQGGKGVNVTVPFKQEAFALLQSHGGSISERARLAEAVNTIKFESTGGLFLDNTDGAGLVRDVSVNLGISLSGKRILLMGAGGAARGVVLPLLAEKPDCLLIANRTPGKARDLAVDFSSHGHVVASGFDGLAGQTFDVVINATSSSLKDELPPLPERVFAAGALAYDMMYGKETPFLRFARVQGAARLADGLGMLVEQAAESFFLWRGVRPGTAPAIALLKAQ